MEPPHSLTVLIVKNQLMMGKNHHLLTKDELRLNGLNSGMKKNSTPGFVGMDDNKMEGLLKEANRFEG